MSAEQSVEDMLAEQRCGRVHLDETAIRADERRKVAEEIARAIEVRSGNRCPECGGLPGSVKYAPAWGSSPLMRCGGGHTWSGHDAYIQVHAATGLAREIGGAR